MFIYSYSARIQCDLWHTPISWTFKREGEIVQRLGLFVLERTSEVCRRQTFKCAVWSDIVKVISLQLQAFCTHLQYRKTLLYLKTCHAGCH